MIETILHKREAKFPKEIGLFADMPVSSDDMQIIAMNSDVMVKVGSQRNLKYNAYVWALATKLSEAVDGLHDKDDALEYLCLKCNFTRTTIDPETGEVEITRGSTRRLKSEEFLRLINRMVWVVCNQILPGIEESRLRAEVERMVSR